MERRIRRLVRWNAAAMVARANKHLEGIGGHISTYASGALAVRGRLQPLLPGQNFPGGGDHVFFQGHAAPGIYARTFLEGRWGQEKLDRFRQEALLPGPSSYPHPRLMPEFWEFPTVSMGLSPLNAIYQARFNRYPLNRGISDTSKQRVWAFVGDGEMDEPESMAALSLASRESLDNLIFVVNCNLQRLDGPVRGNGKIIQELESIFRGAGWHVIKVIWGREWDELLAPTACSSTRWTPRWTGSSRSTPWSPSSTSASTFGPTPVAAAGRAPPDDDLRKLRRGGHDYRKLHAAYATAVELTGAPTVILAKTVKGWTLPSTFEARNVTHQMKKLGGGDEGLPRPARAAHPDKDLDAQPLLPPGDGLAGDPVHAGPPAHPGRGHPRAAVHATTRRPAGRDLRAVRRGHQAGRVDDHGVRGGCLRPDARPAIGKRIVSIIPDEARTFGMESLFPSSIYADTASHTSRWTPSISWPTSRPRTARSWRRASPEAGPWRPSSPPARRT